jgi:acyl-[acyl-carrier-protein] desaturase
VRGLSESAEKARDYLLELPARLEKVAARMNVKPTEYKFSWIYG